MTRFDVLISTILLLVACGLLSVLNVHHRPQRSVKTGQLGAAGSGSNLLGRFAVGLAGAGALVIFLSGWTVIAVYLDRALTSAFQPSEYYAPIAWTLGGVLTVLILLMGVIVAAKIRRTLIRFKASRCR